MSFIDKWLNPPRTIGCSDTKQSTIYDELRILRINERVYDEALTTMLGESWAKIPVRDMMSLFNMRFGGTPIDYSKKEVASIIHLMKNCADDLSPDQVRFLRENDHLPRSKNEDGGIWMDSSELHSYSRDNEDSIHKRKMDYFITMNGVLAAHQQGLNPSHKAQKAPKKPFKLSMVHMVIIAAIVIGIIMMAIL